MTSTAVSAVMERAILVADQAEALKGDPDGGAADGEGSVRVVVRASYANAVWRATGLPVARMGGRRTGVTVVFSLRCESRWPPPTSCRARRTRRPRRRPIHRLDRYHFTAPATRPRKGAHAVRPPRHDDEIS